MEHQPGVTFDGSSDEALLAGMASGDSRAATALVRRYQKRVFGLAYSVVGDVATAEEVAQEALLRVWRHAAVFDARRGAVSSWVLTITRNLAIDALRMRRSTPVDPDDFVMMTQMSHENSPEDAAMVADGAPAVRAALASLPDEQRRALVLAAVYGRTAVEISESEQIPLGTAKTRIRAGLQKMRAALVDQRGTHDEWERAVDDG
jgi:RNA polymerase sigma-70 factor (ECF subfamily)